MAHESQATVGERGMHAGPDFPSHPAITEAVTSQVQAILEAAERAAAEIQREVEDEAARRASVVRHAAEQDAARIRAEAEAEAAAQLMESRQAAEAFARERITRLTRLTDDLIARSEQVLGQLDEAAQARRSLEELLSHIAASAEAIAHVTSSPGPELRRPGAEPVAEPVNGAGQ